MNRSPARSDFEPLMPPDDGWVERNFEANSLGLAWLKQRLTDYIASLRTGRPATETPVGGIRALTDLEADWLLRGGSGGCPSSDDSVSARRAYIACRDTMLAEGTPAAIDNLSQIFGLSEFEEDVVLMVLAPFLDATFSALYGYTHDRLRLDCPTPHLIVAMLTDGRPATAMLARRFLSPAATLRRHHLVQCPSEQLTALSPLVTDEALACFLAGETGNDVRLGHLLRPVDAGPCIAEMLSDADRFAAKVQSERVGSVLIQGPPRSGRRTISARLAAGMGLGLRELLPHRLPPAGPEQTTALRLVARESILRGLAVMIDLSQGPSEPTAGGTVTATSVTESLMMENPALVVILASKRPDLPSGIPCLRTAELNEAQRTALWQSAYPDFAHLPGLSADVLAQHFQLGPSEITSVCSETAGALDGGNLWRACRDAASRGLAAMADRIEPRFEWDDIVLPEDIRTDLKAVASQVRHRGAVYSDGGFARKLVRGRGVSALFAGPSGVGKTMAAEVIARELDLDLYRIDLSRVISKYIGETEQNLRRVFDAAEAGGAVLFFDEADALFGKRSEVKDSHDRYANIEISYLLQRMETYSGLAILATNLKSHIDSAFLRRLRFVIDLPFPDAALRETIWANAFPKETKTEGLDFKALGRLDVAGGNIVVIAVNAAFLAAAEGTPVCMDHIGQAARAEMRKLDKEFRPCWAVGGVG